MNVSFVMALLPVSPMTLVSFSGQLVVGLTSGVFGVCFGLRLVAAECEVGAKACILRVLYR